MSKHGSAPVDQRLVTLGPSVGLGTALLPNGQIGPDLAGRAAQRRWQRCRQPAAEWLWAEYEGLATAQEIFDFNASIPADDPFWVSGQQLDVLFDDWLFTPEKPAVLEGAAARVQSGAADLGSARSPLDKLAERTGLRR